MIVDTLLLSSLAELSVCFVSVRVIPLNCQKSERQEIKVLNHGRSLSLSSSSPSPVSVCVSIDKEYFTVQLTAKELRVFVIYSG